MCAVQSASAIQRRKKLNFELNQFHKARLSFTPRAHRSRDGRTSFNNRYLSLPFLILDDQVFFGTILYNDRHSGRSAAETRARSEALALSRQLLPPWIPAFAGMTEKNLIIEL